MDKILLDKILYLLQEHQKACRTKSSNMLDTESAFWNMYFTLEIQDRGIVYNIIRSMRLNY